MICNGYGTQTVASNRNQFAVKLTDIFPELKYLHDYGAIPLLNNNTCQFTITLIEANKCMIATGGDPSYVVNKCHVVR